jgi:hypothetical protein
MFKGSSHAYLFFNSCLQHWGLSQVEQVLFCLLLINQLRHQSLSFIRPKIHGVMVVSFLHLTIAGNSIICE